jgi:hypothetical protein
MQEGFQAEFQDARTSEYRFHVLMRASSVTANLTRNS